MWALHDRQLDLLTEQSCAAEIESFRIHGQRIPVLGRPAKNDTEYEVELIYGARRLFVARCVSCDLLVDLREISDKEAIVEMDIENRARNDISPYERGISYRNLLAAGYFRSQTELARALGLSETKVCRLLAFGRLPAAVIAAFPSPIDIREAWAVTLSKELESPESRQAILNRARMLARGQGMSAENVFKELQRHPSEKRRKTTLRDQVITTRGSRDVSFRVSRRYRDIHIILPTGVASEPVLERVCSSIRNILDQEREVVNGGLSQY
jgi:ParB family chromosome partitioning protein